MLKESLPFQEFLPGSFSLILTFFLTAFPLLVKLKVFVGLFWSLLHSWWCYINLYTLHMNSGDFSVLSSHTVTGRVDPPLHHNTHLLLLSTSRGLVIILGHFIYVQVKGVWECFLSGLEMFCHFYTIRYCQIMLPNSQIFPSIVVQKNMDCCLFFPLGSTGMNDLHPPPLKERHILRLP